MFMYLYIYIYMYHICITYVLYMYYICIICIIYVLAIEFQPLKCCREISSWYAVTTLVPTTPTQRPGSAGMGAMERDADDHRMIMG